jgi:hypothetical protein
MSEAPEMEGQGVAPETAGQAVEQNNWYNGADEETIGYIQNKGWDNPLKAVEGYKNLEKFQGVAPEQILKLPKDMTEDGSLDEVYTRLGRPETPDAYNLELPEGVQVNEDRVQSMASVAHKVGLNDNQLNALAAADAEYQAQYMQEVSKQQQVELQGLEKEWGAAFPEREEMARRFVRNTLPDGVDKEAFLTQIENAIGTANMLKMFANAGQSQREHGVPDSSGDRPYGYTREQAVSDKKTLMDEIKADPARLANYNKGVGPDLDKMKRLNTIITG